MSDVGNFLTQGTMASVALNKKAVRPTLPPQALPGKTLLCNPPFTAEYNQYI